MPSFTGVLFIGLSIRDITRSARWYAEVLGFTPIREAAADERRLGAAILRHPDSGLLLGLVAHRANPGGPFSEFRTGLDHVEFRVADLGELRAWEARLDELGVEHAPITERTAGYILTFRDPDSIQLEFCVPK